jgi:hypothetical protein
VLLPHHLIDALRAQTISEGLTGFGGGPMRVWGVRFRRTGIEEIAHPLTWKV